MNEFFSYYLCINPVYINGYRIELYEVGKYYKGEYLYDRCLIADNDYIEFEWKIYCSKTNHYQFTDSDFRLCFADIVEQRDIKIDQIIYIENNI